MLKPVFSMHIYGGGEIKLKVFFYGNCKGGNMENSKVVGNAFKKIIKNDFSFAVFLLLQDSYLFHFQENCTEGNFHFQSSCQVRIESLRGMKF